MDTKQKHSLGKTLNAEAAKCTYGPLHGTDNHLDHVLAATKQTYSVVVDGVNMHAVHLELLLQEVLLQLLKLSMRESAFKSLIVFSSIGQQVHGASAVSAALLAVCTCFALRRRTYDPTF